jgi:hypothetical protein
MKITLVHAAAAVALVAVAYAYGKKRATLATKATADANIQTPAEWWSYPGLWNAQ